MKDSLNIVSILGNFIYGGQWSSLENCEDVVENSNITVNLTSILRMENAKNYVPSVIDMLNRYELQIIDINLITQFLEKLLRFLPDDSLWVSIVDKLLDTSEDNLRNVQNDYKSVERILKCTKDLIDLLPSVDFKGDNLIILSKKTTTNLEYISWVNETTSYQLKLHYAYEEDIEIRTNENTIILAIPKNLIPEFVTIIAFNQPKFFHCIGVYQKFLPPVILISQTNNSKKSTETLLTVEYQYTGSDSICFISTFENSARDFFWKQLNHTIEKDNGNIVCQFPLNTYFGLIENINVTNELEEIKKEISLCSTLERTNDLLKYFHYKFQPIDVELVTHIVQNANEKSLSIFLDIMNEMMNINLNIMMEAENEYGTGDKMLRHAANLLTHFREEKTHPYSNLFVAHIEHQVTSRVNCTGNNCEITLLEVHDSCDESDISILWPYKEPITVIILFKNPFRFSESHSKSPNLVGLFYPHHLPNQDHLIKVLFGWKNQEKGMNISCGNMLQNEVVWQEFEAVTEKDSTANLCLIESG